MVNLLLRQRDALGPDWWEMDWAKPQYSRSQVDRAGEHIVKQDCGAVEIANAILVLENWRTSHAYPLNVFQITLRNRARKTYKSAAVVQRLKRFASIEGKLKNQAGMKLSRMQDIGGCRAIVSTVELVDRLAYKYKDTGYHEFYKEFDYIRHPKPSGYRGIHLTYRYRPDREELKVYSGMSIEIQLRSSHQHAWATAVEMVDVMTGQALKAGRGDSRWDRFFALMGTALANIEGTERVPDTPHVKSVLQKELRELATTLKVTDTLEASRVFIGPQVKKKKGDLFLLKLDYQARQVEWSTYRTDQLEYAMERLAVLEAEARETPSLNVVLVGADDLRAVKRAYPNYFMDSTAFIAHVNQALGRAA